MKQVLIIIGFLMIINNIGCGGSYLVEGTVQVEHHIKLEDLEPYFYQLCKDLNEHNECYSSVLSECSKCLVADVIANIAE